MFLAAVLCAPAALAQQSLESDYRSTGKSVTAAFEPAREKLQQCSAVLDVKNGLARDEVCFGTVVSADGYILTKLSEIKGVPDIRVTVDRRRFETMRIVAEDPAWDVALIKVDATGLVPADFSDVEPERGTWVIGNGATTRLKRYLNPGIISASGREIPAEGGVALGVVFHGPKDLRVKEFPEKSNARDAGMKPGDRIVAIGETQVSTVEEMAKALDGKKAGEEISVHVSRGGKAAVVAVRLSARGDLGMVPMSRNDAMSGMFSKRRSGFPRVIQHSVIANRNVVGGPVLDLDGKCVGMNIARANRAETFAIPAKETREIFQRLKPE